MASEEIQRHIDVVRALSRPGEALGADAPTASIRNSQWWVAGHPTPSRERLHRRLRTQVWESAPDVLQERQALVLAGPPGAGKGSVKGDVLGARLATYRNVDADEFKELLLDEAGRDGSLEGWLKPDTIRDLEVEGERFFPLELASLVHEESSYLARLLRDRAIAAGDNIVVDTVLSGEASALELGDRLAAEGYRVQVVDVEVPFKLSEKRIRSRWQREYQAAIDGRSDLGGRWVPSEYARDVFDGPEGRSKPEHNARVLAEQCSAVADFRVYRTGMDQADSPQAQPLLEVHRQRSRPGAELRAVETPQERTAGPSASRSSVRDASFPGRSSSAGPTRPGSTPPRGPTVGRDGGAER
ncbi:zeta toxin family protein [Brachybacterium sp. UNK5269]|uniref:zeta toxin family protein n=1 Tax=Brachybacterium sp. UNK5269 TaxID=3408576 RepID=UPI003BAF0BB6